IKALSTMDRSLDVIDRVELRQIRIFIAVGEELHFGRAAERLDMVQSAVSQTIRQLETELEVPLFERTSRRVRLTPAGEALLVAGQELLTSAARLRRGVREAVRGQTGYVRIAGVPAAWWSI